MSFRDCCISSKAETNCCNYSSQNVLAVALISSTAAIIITSLAGTYQFGVYGSTGYIAGIAISTALLSVALTGIISVACKRSVAHSQENVSDDRKSSGVTDANPVNLESINNYFRNFESLFKEENWDEILLQGQAAIEEARRTNKPHDEAKISAKLTSISYYKGDYNKALTYVKHCRELSEQFKNEPTLLIEALYLESAVYRALTSKERDEEKRKTYYLHSINSCSEAHKLYLEKNVQNEHLLAKIFFNWGAAYADNLELDHDALGKSAGEHAQKMYSQAFELYKTPEDQVRTLVRLGKLYLLQNQMDDCKEVLNKIRPHIDSLSKRTFMQVKLLETEVYIFDNQYETARAAAERGLEIANALGAEEDKKRFLDLLVEMARIYFEENQFDHYQAIVDNIYKFQSSFSLENSIDLDVLKIEMLVLNENYEEAKKVAFEALQKANELGTEKDQDIVIPLLLHLGKVYLGKKELNDCQEIINKLGSLSLLKKDIMELDLLEAQVFLARNEYKAAKNIAHQGFQRANELGAEEEKREFLQIINL